MEIIDRPGFIIVTISEKNQETYLRQLFLPERLLELIEKKIVEEYGDLGKSALYSIGKKFGYVYSSMSNFPTRINNNEKELKDFIYLFVRYCESTYAQRAEHYLDLDKKIFTINFNGYIICRHNGLGFIMTDGGCAGIWAYMMQDKEIEAIQLECEGRGHQRCYVFCGPTEEIKEQTTRFYQESNLTDTKFDDVYRKLNEIQKTTYAKNSLKDLIDIGFIDYKQGVLAYKGMRFFSCDSHLIYILEDEIKKLNNGEKLLFEASAEFGEELQKLYGETDYQKFIMDFFPALGFGDIFIAKSEKLKVISDFYPWTSLSDRSRYIIFRGILSGFVSSSVGQKIEINHFDVNLLNHLTLTLNTD